MQVMYRVQKLNYMYPFVMVTWEICGLKSIMFIFYQIEKEQSEKYVIDKWEGQIEDRQRVSTGSIHNDQEYVNCFLFPESWFRMNTVLSMCTCI